MLVVIKDNQNFVIRHENEPEDHTFKIDMQGTIYGYKGRPIKNLPKGFKKIDFVFANMEGIDNQYKNLLFQIVNGSNAEAILFFERMCNAGITNLETWVTPRTNNLIAKRTFNQWLTLAREYHQVHPDIDFTLSDLDRYAEYKAFLNVDGMQDIIHYYGENIARNLYNKFSNHWNRVNKWLRDDDLYKAYKIFSKNYYGYDLEEIFYNMFNWSDLLKIKLSNKNPLDQYLKLQRQYELHKNQIADLTLQKNQNQEWSIENDNFIAIVPTTMQELITEGQNNHNCVGDYWTSHYGNNLHKGIQNRGLIFIRKKSNPDKSFITCDFTLDDFQIRQFLGNCNHEVSDKNAILFGELLQKHLSTFA